MRFLGQAEIAAFSVDYLGAAQALQAWAAEIQQRVWDSPAALAADFKSVDVRQPPLAVFRFNNPGLLIETLVDFRNGILLVIAIRPFDLQPSHLH